MKHACKTLLLAVALGTMASAAQAESFGTYLKTLKKEALAAGHKASTVRAATRGLKPKFEDYSADHAPAGIPLPGEQIPFQARHEIAH